MKIDLYSKIPFCEHFYWHEALYCSAWGVFVFPDDKQHYKIKMFALKLEKVRTILNAPMHMTSWLRPTKYNKWPYPYGINGAKRSHHPTGGAGDFKVANKSSDEVRYILKPYLRKLGLRMENLPGASWVHLDDKKPFVRRFFIP